ncbi:LysR family transcriptional regulator [Sphingomonas sp.]|uniref:LysR family transcriptional regulator n=1 Tax=Sphingomonas sp. TaxID=28214 RepID=UPI003AFF9D6A
MKRTHLPLNALRVFDAAARHLSFTRAADELAVTPAAVGQQVRALEDTLGVVLFRRTTRGLELTPEGETGLEPLRRGFLEFEEAVRAMRAGQTSKTLTIAAPRDVAGRWLAPRLAAYAARDPELRFVVLAADGGIDFTEANLDLAILYASGPGDNEGVALDDGTLMMVGREEGGAEAIAWPGWAVTEGPRVLTVADAGLAIDAAAAGIGRATVPALLAAGDIEARRVADLGRQPGERRYWLVAPLPQWRQAKVRAVVAVLTGD